MLRRLTLQVFNKNSSSTAQLLSGITAQRSTFYAHDLEISVNENAPDPPADFHSDQFLADLPFGSLPSPHMLHIDWTAKGGWGKPKIKPSGNIVIPPTSGSLHYGMQVFEGMKAYYQFELDRIVMFRPDMNAKRMINSSRAVALPSDFDPDELVECIKALVDLDRDWVPKNESGSMYIRPTHIATNNNLGVATPDSSKLFVMLTPVGPYFKTGLQPVDLLADPKYIRAWPGGTGSAKCGGNYGPTIPVQKSALQNHGCSQVLWLFDDGHTDGPIITEAGTMNFFMVWKRPEDGKIELVTPPLDDDKGNRTRDFILPGVTRDSLLTLGRKWNLFEVSERTIRWGDFKQAVKEDRIIEAFGAGTACVVQPIGRFWDKTENPEGEWITIPCKDQTYRKMFYNALIGIKNHGRKAPDRNWLVVC